MNKVSLYFYSLTSVLSNKRRSFRTIFPGVALLLFLAPFISFQNAGAASGDESIIFLHHSTGNNLYNEGGVASWFSSYNSTNSTNYRISEIDFPDYDYGWRNYPYDYWHLWVNGRCTNYNQECLDELDQNYDVVIFKHCYPGADVLADTGSPSVSSSTKTLENYYLQYNALKTALHNYPDTDFIVWTLAPRHRMATNSSNAARAAQFVDWVKNVWDEPNDNIHIFDFWGHAAETNTSPPQGTVNTLKYEYERSHSRSDSHPNTLANQDIGPLFSQFIVDTIEGDQSEDCSLESTRCVPSEYASVSAANSAANDGDIIAIEAGEYTGTGIVATISDDNLTIRGVNGRAHLNASGVSISNRKAVFVTTGDNITIENIEFSNAAVRDGNGAGIRVEGGDLTVRNCYFHDNENGILTGNTSSQATAEILVEYSEFNHNGLGYGGHSSYGYTHNIYVNHAAKLTFRYNYSHHANVGHNLKTRASENHILYNRIMDETTGNASYQIDVPNGGLTYIIGNTLHQGANASNSRLISYAAEGASNPIQELYVSGNTFVNDRSSGSGIRISGTPTSRIVNNIFDNIGTAVTGTATVFENNLESNNNYFVDRGNYDFHLTGTSPALNIAGSPGTGNGVDLTPANEYLHTANQRTRPDDGNLDIGAFEYEGSVSPPTAAFTTNPSPAEGDAPLTVNFYDASTGNPTSWSWDFDGDGQSDSVEQSDSYTYNTPGTYTVTFTVTNGGGSDTATGQVVVNSSVDLSDVILPLQVASGLTPAGISVQDDDANGDGRLGIADAIIALRKLAGMPAD